MSPVRNRIALAAVIVALIAAAAPAASAAKSKGIGPYLGYGESDWFLGARAELGTVLGSATFVPGIDFTLGDGSFAAIHADFRWYLFPLPDTGIRFYGVVGPTIVTGGNTEVGLTLAAGLNIPMKKRNRYNAEVRFGIGDIPDVRFLFALLFGF